MCRRRMAARWNPSWALLPVWPLALANLSWPMKDYKALVAQMEQVQGIPQVPGGYYSWRNVNNAFYTVTTNTATNNTTPREALMDKIYYINAEINYKREEFDLPLAEEE